MYKSVLAGMEVSVQKFCNVLLHQAQPLTKQSKTVTISSQLEDNVTRVARKGYLGS